MEPEAQQSAAAPTGGQAPTEDAPDFEALPRRQIILTMGGVMLALLMASLDQTIVSTALPRIVADLGGFDRFTWITGSYLIASTTTVPIVGRLSDLYGRKNFYVVGIATFLVGSVLSGLSQTMDQLIAFRAVQGLGAGVMMANSFAAVGDLFPPAERGKYQGFLAAVFGVSSVIGPTLGGFITDTLSWNWIFYINIPIGVPIIILFIMFFPAHKPARREHHLDIPGIVALILTIVPLLLALTWGGVQYPWLSVQVLGPIVLSVAALAAFIWIELRATEPIMPLGMYKNSIVSLSLLATFGTGFGMFGAIVFIPLYFQGVLGASATSSGSFLTPMMLGMVFGAAASGQALSRLGGRYRVQGLLGIGLMAAGLYLISTMTPETTFRVAVLYIVIMGVGMGITFPVFTLAVQNSVPHRFLGVATSAAQFYRSVGGVIGLAVLGSYMTRQFTSALDGSVPPEVGEALPPGRLDDIANNPQELVNHQALDALKDSFASAGPEGLRLVEQLLDALRSSLASAIGDVFLVAVVAVMATFVTTLFLKEVPLITPGEAARKGPDAEEVEAAGG